MPSVFSVAADGHATGEGFGIAYLEAAMAGRASIASRHGGHQDLISDSVNGWLVGNQVSDLSDLLFELSTNPTKVASCGHNALMTAKQKFSIQNQSRSLIRLLYAR